jgi:hypothetical protein
MRKSFVIILVVLSAFFVSNSAYAIGFNIDGTGAGTSVTVNEFDVDLGLALIRNDFTTGNLNRLGTFTEVATFRSAGYDGTDPSWALDHSREFTAVFVAAGDINNPTNFSFTSGTLYMYVDNTATPADRYSHANGFYGANNGTLVASWDLLSGGGTLGDNFTPVDNGTITSNFVGTYFAPGYFFRPGDNADLSLIPVYLTLGIATVNAGIFDDPNTGLPISPVPFNAEVAQYLGLGGPVAVDMDASDFFQDFYVANGGQFQMSVVPEPGTLILLGIGLVGLAGIGRKKLSKKA